MDLSAKEADSVESIKLKDIEQSVEQAIGQAKDVSDVFNALVSKRLEFD